MLKNAEQIKAALAYAHSARTRFEIRAVVGIDFDSGGGESARVQIILDRDWPKEMALAIGELTDVKTWTAQPNNYSKVALVHGEGGHNGVRVSFCCTTQEWEAINKPAPEIAEEVSALVDSLLPVASTAEVSE